MIGGISGGAPFITPVDNSQRALRDNNDSSRERVNPRPAGAPDRATELQQPQRAGNGNQATARPVEARSEAQSVRSQPLSSDNVPLRSQQAIRAFADVANQNTGRDEVELAGVDIRV